MKMRFTRRPPLLAGGKSTKLSPVVEDKELDFAAFRRTTPAASMRPSSSNLARVDILSGHRGFGPEIGVELVSSKEAPFELMPHLGSKRH